MKDGSLLFVEIQGRTISRLSPEGRVKVVARLEGGPNGLAIGPDGAAYVANNGGRFTFRSFRGFTAPGPSPPGHPGGLIQKLDLRSGRVSTLYDRSPGRRLVAPNDLVFDKRGGIWLSDIGTRPDNGGVYYARPDGTFITLARPMEAPNGIGLSPDGGTLYVSAVRSLYAFRILGPGKLVPAGSRSDGVVADLGDGAIADSLKVQADGRICVCVLLQGGIRVIDHAGHGVMTPFPDPFPTNLAFGGPDLRDVYVTLSGAGRIARVRWPSPGLAPAFMA